MTDIKSNFNFTVRRLGNEFYWLKLKFSLLVGYGVYVTIVPSSQSSLTIRQVTPSWRIFLDKIPRSWNTWTIWKMSKGRQFGIQLTGIGSANLYFTGYILNVRVVICIYLIYWLNILCITQSMIILISLIGFFFCLTHQNHRNVFPYIDSKVKSGRRQHI